MNKRIIPIFSSTLIFRLDYLWQVFVIVFLVISRQAKTFWINTCLMPIWFHFITDLLSQVISHILSSIVNIGKGSSVFQSAPTFRSTQERTAINQLSRKTNKRRSSFDPTRPSISLLSAPWHTYAAHKNNRMSLAQKRSSNSLNHFNPLKIMYSRKLIVHQSSKW